MSSADVLSELGNVRKQGCTFVFFIRHLSHAFQTLLCRPSITTAPCSCDKLVLVLFVALCEVAEDFLVLVVRREPACGAGLSSTGGVGKPEIILSYTKNLQPESEFEKQKKSSVRFHKSHRTVPEVSEHQSLRYEGCWIDIYQWCGWRTLWNSGLEYVRSTRSREPPKRISARGCAADFQLLDCTGTSEEIRAML